MWASTYCHISNGDESLRPAEKVFSEPSLENQHWPRHNALLPRLHPPTTLYDEQYD